MIKSCICRTCAAWRNCERYLRDCYEDCHDCPHNVTTCDDFRECHKCDCSVPSICKTCPDKEVKPIG